MPSPGAARRFQVLGTARGVTVVDDYAHHPTELRATLAAARSREPRRVVLVVQPHRYSRTRVFGAELGRAAAAADVVVVTDVYAASESPEPGVSGRAGRRRGRGRRRTGACGSRTSARCPPTLAELVEDGDLVLVTGAGDVNQVGPALLGGPGGPGD